MRSESDAFDFVVVTAFAGRELLVQGVAYMGLAGVCVTLGVDQAAAVAEVAPMPSEKRKTSSSAVPVDEHGEAAKGCHEAEHSCGQTQSCGGSSMVEPRVPMASLLGNLTVELEQ